jgi:hypothetical protein
LQTETLPPESVTCAPYAIGALAPLPKPHAGAATILGDEYDAGRFEGTLYSGERGPDYRPQQPRRKGVGYRVRWIITALLLRVIAPLLWLTRKIAPTP